MRSLRWLGLWSLATVAWAASPAGADRLYRQFLDPPRQFSVRPFWFWNGKLEPGEVERQIREMVSQGVYGAYVHNRTGLETRYFSEEYFRVVQAAFEASRKRGFMFGLVDEYEWPSGEARDIWRAGPTSRVVAANPDFRIRSLGYVERRASGPARLAIETPEPLEFAVGARLTGEAALEADSLTLLPSATGKTLQWEVPAGQWLVMAFYLFPARGIDGGTVDLLNAAAVRQYLDLVYEEYYRRFGAHFGTTIDSTYADHEGAYGYRLAWTPTLFDTFRRTKGYDLRKSLPLLIYDGGKPTPKVRCDYLDAVSELYYRSFFKQVGDWCRAHRIDISGHVWEETLLMEAAFVGDLQRLMRGWTWPGVDSLLERGRSPRDFKAAASVAHFEGRRFTCENQGLQGADSYLDLQKMRLGTNLIALWGVDLFIPHAFNYHRRRIEYPSDWFYHQPYWRYFKHYADYARRISFMNSGGRHIAPVLLFQPTESAWAHSEPAFSAHLPYQASKWNNPLDAINAYYTSLMNRLAEERWDFDVADSHYLLRAEIRDGRLHIGNESFRALVLPPMTTVRREVWSKIRAFHEQGGLVIAVNRLPTDSMEEGRDDPQVAGEARRLFGDGARPQAHFVKEDVGEVIRILERALPPDVKVVEGERARLLALHRQKEDADFYWLVNDTDRPRANTVQFAARGAAEKWDAETGRREPLDWRSTAAGTEVRLRFEPWDAYYVVFRPAPAAAAPARSASQPPLPPIELSGPWTFTPQQTAYAAPYGTLLPENRRVWLSRERLTLRQWWLLGPFPNPDHRGFAEAYPPEKSVDLSASYAGAGGAALRWRKHVSEDYVVSLEQALGLKRQDNWITSYAFCYLYSPAARRVQFRIAADNNARLWVNGQNLLDLHIHPFYYEMREDFALTREADLRAGWNEVLVKISKGQGARRYAFMLRVTDAQGENISDLICANDRSRPEPAPSAAGALRYRIPVPPGATGVRLPRFRRAVAVRHASQELRPGPDGVFQLAGSVGDLEVETAGEEMPDCPVFLLGRTRLGLGSWTDLGLPYYSGSALYEREFDLPVRYRGGKLTLDCGRVGVAAEVWVNGRPAGTRVWLPFAFDISKLARPGLNRLRILVTNTMENQRAVENHAAKLEKIQPNGLDGPVRILCAPGPD